MVLKSNYVMKGSGQLLCYQQKYVLHYLLFWTVCK